jgi:hypothetical protein
MKKPWRIFDLSEVGIGFAITELSIMVARKSYPFSSRFLVLARKATEKSPKRKRGV